MTRRIIVVGGFYRLHLPWYKYCASKKRKNETESYNKLPTRKHDVSECNKNYILYPLRVKLGMRTHYFVDNNE